MNKFGYLKKEWFDIYDVISSSEKMVNQDPNFSLIKLRQVVELVTEHILTANDIQKPTDLVDAVNLLSNCKGVSHDVVYLFNEIRITGNKAVHELYSDINLANSFLDRIFKVLVWFAVEYSNEDYSKIDLGDMPSETKLVFYEYLMKKQLADNKRLIQQSKNTERQEDLINPFNISNSEILKGFIGTSDKSRYEKDVFETYEEFFERIKNLETIIIGNILIEPNQYNQTEDIAAFAFTIFKGLPVKMPSIDLLYIDKKQFKDNQIRQEKYNLVSQLDVVDGEVRIDIQNIYIKEGENKCKVHCVVLDKTWYKNQEDYKSRIFNISEIPFGIVMIDKYKYDLDKEILPINIDYYEWLNRYAFNKEGFLNIGRKEAKVLCEENLYYPLVGKLYVLDDELQIKHCCIYSKVINKKFNLSFQNTRGKLLKYLVSAEEGNLKAMFEAGYLYYSGDETEVDYQKAMKWFKRAAEKGHSEAMFWLGHMYQKGLGTAVDLKEAAKWYEKAAEKGYVIAMNNLGYMYHFGKGVDVNYTEAMKWYRRAAEKEESVTVANNIAYMYERGQGVDKNYEEAVTWYKKAAAKGDASAMNSIGCIYKDEQGLPVNYNEAIEWYKKAAAKGNPDAMNNLGNMYEDGEGLPVNYEEAMEWYKKAVEIGNPEGMNYLGLLYEEGKGSPVNYEVAMEWYKKAAEKGNQDAMYNIGALFYYGQGVETNYEEAANWFRKASDAGDEYSMEWLGDLYRRGKGVKQDSKEALEWYEKAAEKGNASAMNWIGYMHYHGEGVKSNYEEAIKWFRKASDAGNEISMDWMGYLYQNGKGLKQDFKVAMIWYEKAAEEGNASSMNSLGNIYRDGLGVPVDYNKAMEWYKKAAEKGNKDSQKNIVKLEQTLTSNNKVQESKVKIETPKQDSLKDRLKKIFF